MMKKDIILGTLMVIIALLLATNLFLGHGLKLFCAEASAESAQKIAYRGNGVSVACSEDGRYVYAAGSGKILRSTEFGKTGSWEVVVEE